MRPAPLTVLTPDVPDDLLLTPEDLASIAKVGVHTARELISHGTIPGGIRIGRLLRIPAKAVRLWFESESLPKNREVYDLRQRLHAI